MPTEELVFEALRLQKLTQMIVEAGGLTPADAARTAQHLVLANLKGHDSHGIGMLPSYIRDIGRGFLSPKSRGEVVIDSGAVLLIDGKEGMGQVVAWQAIERAIEKARKSGLVCMGLKNAHHIGRIGTYGEQCAEAGMVSVHFVNAVGHLPIVSPFGGAEAKLQTNPFCCAVPRSGHPPLVLDMATSFIAAGKVRVAYNAGRTLPDGAVKDHEGSDSNDPKALFDEPRGSLKPFGLYKGFGLALMCELLGGALVGQWTMQPEHTRKGTSINNMLTFILDPQVFGGVETFHKEVEAMIAELHATKPAKGHDKVLVAGEPELIAKADREVNGIPVDMTTWRGYCWAAHEVNVDDATIEDVGGHPAATT